MKSPTPIIALTGPAGCGKDTVADYLCATHGFVKLAFADALRLEVCQAFGAHLDLLLDRDAKEVPTKAMSLARCNDHRFVGLMLADEINMDEAGDEIVQAHMSQPRSPRWVMQRWESEYRKSVFGADYWITEWIEARANHNRPIVVPDCRFASEAEFLSMEGAEVWAIHRAGLLPVAAHASEIPLPRYYIDRDIDNDSNLEALHNQIESALAMMDLARRGAA